MGFRLSLENITQLGGASLFLIFILIFITILFGYFFSLVLLKNKDFGLLSAGSVAICGASAAIAIFSILPKNKIGTRLILSNYLSNIIIHNSHDYLSIIFDLHRSQRNQKGFLIGSTIHDVAQVIGAGYSVSEQTGIIATFVKMIRVSITFFILFLLLLSRKIEKFFQFLVFNFVFYFLYNK